MELLSATIPNVNLIDILKHNCTGTLGNTQYFRCMATDEGGAPTGEIYYNMFWLQDDFQNRNAAYHSVTSDYIRNNNRRHISGTGLTCKNLIRPVIRTNTTFTDNDTKYRYRINGYIFEPIPDTQCIICTSYIGLSCYRKNPYSYIDHTNHANDKIKSDAHDYEKSDIKPIVDEWFEKIIKNHNIEILTYKPITVNVNYDLMTWVSDTDDAKSIAVEISENSIKPYIQKNDTLHKVVNIQIS